MPTIQHRDIPEAQLHEPKGVSTATLGQAYIATGAATGTWKDPTPNLKFITAESDFVTQDTASITLAAQTVYVIAASFSTSKYFVVGDASVITSINVLGPLLTYTGVGAMFRGTDSSFTIRDIQISHPSGDGFDFTDTVGGQKIFVNSFVRTVEGVKYGTFNNMQTVLIDNSSTLDMDDGITVTGANNVIFSVDKFYIGTTSATCIGVEFSATFIAPTVEINDFVFAGVAGSIGIQGLASSGNLPAGSIAQVTNCEFLGAVTPLQNITVNDVRWSFKNNAGLPDTLLDCLLSLNGNATPTTISVASTPVKVTGTWVVERASKYTGDTTGRATYNGERGMTTPVEIVTTIESSSGTNKDIKVYLAKNGTVIANSAKSNRVSSGDPKNTTVLWQLDLEENDYLEVFVSNETDTVSLIVKDAILRVN